MSRTLNLAASVSVVLDSSGNGTASTGPKGTRESWTPSTASVSVSTNVNESVCKIYVTSPLTFVDGTTWGSTGDNTSNFAITLYPGQAVEAVWTGGDPGSLATLAVMGTRQVP